MTNPTILKMRLQSHEQYKCIAVSTSHLTPSDSEALDVLVQRTKMTMKRDTGWFMKLYDEPEYLFAEDFTGLSKPLWGLIQDIHSAGYRMIEFDSDAEVVDGYETFIW